MKGSRSRIRENSDDCEPLVGNLTICDIRNSSSRNPSWRSMMEGPSNMLSRLRVISLVLICLLSSMPTSAAKAQPPATAALAPRRALVVLIGGMDSDPTPAQIAGQANRDGNSGLYRLMGDLQHARISSEYFNWNGTRAGMLKSRAKADVTPIVETIRNHARQHPRDRIVLVGNSWGGHTTWEMCQSLIDSPHPVAIDYAVFLDPSSAGRADKSRPKHLPINIVRATNIYTRNLFGWRHWPKEERIENIDLGDAKQGFLVPGGAAYDASFDFNAHVAAEWDERIHATIKHKILDLVLETRTIPTSAGNPLKPGPNLLPIEKSSKEP